MEVRLSDNGKILSIATRRDTEYADFSQKEIFHLKGFGFNGLTGLSPLAFSAKSAGVAIAMEDNQREFFANGAKSPQILMTDGKVLTKEQRGQLEENFKEIAGGRSKSGFGSESGFTTQPIGVSPQDSEILSAQISGRRTGAILRRASTSGRRCGQNHLWGSGIEQQNLGFLQYTLKPYLDRWEYSIERWLVKESEQGIIHAEHNLDGLLRGDSTSRASFMQIMVNTGIRTVNEVPKAR